MSRSIFIVGPLLLMAITFSYSSLAKKIPVSSKTPNPVQKDPGSPSDQCRLRGLYFRVCKHDNPAKMCENLMCAVEGPEFSYGEGTGPALDGTWCGVKQICSKGKCIKNSKLQKNPFDAEDPETCKLL